MKDMDFVHDTLAPCTQSQAAVLPPIAPGSRILIVGGSPHPCSPSLLADLAATHSLIIACDSALNICQNAQVIPDIAVGDFDSVGTSVLTWARALPITFITSHWHKDETDLGMALRLVHEALYGEADAILSPDAEQEPQSCYWVANDQLIEGVEVTLTSCTGGRLDHQLAIIGKLLEFAHLRPRVIEDAMIATILHDQYRSEVITTLADQHKTASPIALTPKTTLSLSGFEWELNHQDFTLLDMGKLAGTSNIIKAQQARVTVHRGALIFIINNMLEMKKLSDIGALGS